MKNKLIIKLFSVSLIALMIVTSCTKELDETRLEPQISTSNLTGVGADEATVTGFIIAEGDGVTEKGIVYSDTDTLPTLDHMSVVYTGEESGATFTVTITGLEFLTTYYARAYAQFNNDIQYGETFTFTTTPGLPVVTTDGAENVLSSSVLAKGTAVDSSKATITERGFVYATTADPMMDGEGVMTVMDTTAGIGSFEIALMQLTANTSYYVRAYAKNVTGTGYGESIEFTTPDPVLATVSTAEVTGTTQTSAISGGNITDDGGAEVTERGIVLGAAPNPTMNDNVITDTIGGLGEYSAEITGLEEATTYYVRAYAINAAGTSYADEIEFSTLGSGVAPPLYLIGDGSAVGWNNQDTSLRFTWDNENLFYVIHATLTGGAYIKAFEVYGQWAPQWGTDGTGTSEGGPLVYRPTEDDPDPAAIPTPADDGDYKITFDLINMVYTIEPSDLETTMHIIGDATLAGWDNTQAIPMDRTGPGKFELLTELNADASEGFKFLVNQGAWAPMYGTVADAAFESGVLVYRETEADPDPSTIPPPATSGAYLIELDIVAMTYSVTAQ
jgi:starch-binding outer membrane protein SusE/F